MSYRPSGKARIKVNNGKAKADSIESLGLRSLYFKVEIEPDDFILILIGIIFKVVRKV